MNTVTLNVPNINCGHCVHSIQTELSDLEGVKDVKASADTKQVVIQFDAPVDLQTIKGTLADINYPAVD
ncbi:MAG: heavy-metal-associated domain-containing protein [Anaerolineaceae bacterium]|nr:heavy-metal-associated domain-containing protein [Anaerolineaceae bacterium]